MIQTNTLMMCSNTPILSRFRVKRYYGIEKGNHMCYGHNSKLTYYWKYVIPADKFNPLDINKSLKYNIQK